eukprot:CAMPEP_0184380742 /NCGR_PEP_ID=MMETSP0007-20130409/5011_1 /TAXON_ID=97485 /ORGANISM="Prymnesium parvum, Strain Texoma1" /LENGTH=172 /DNA_ID=CAMNT_0026726107 /DNA_START=609 /DNA_END=1127 /DNA_ORIENTATION=+
MRTRPTPVITPRAMGLPSPTASENQRAMLALVKLLTVMMHSAARLHPGVSPLRYDRLQPREPNSRHVVMSEKQVDEHRGIHPKSASDNADSDAHRMWCATISGLSGMVKSWTKYPNAKYWNKWCQEDASAVPERSHDVSEASVLRRALRRRQDMIDMNRAPGNSKTWCTTEL